MPHHFGLSFRPPGLDQQLSIGIFRYDTNISGCSKRVFFLVQADLCRFEPLLGIGKDRRTLQNDYRSAIFKSCHSGVSLILRIAELKVAGLNQLEKHVCVAIETRAGAVGGAEPLARLQIGPAGSIKRDNIFGVLDREFTSLDKRITQSQHRSIEGSDRAGGIASYDIRLERLIHTENHARILTRLDHLRSTLLVELCIDLASGEALIHLT